jgi:phage baseplate assembly protein W
MARTIYQIAPIDPGRQQGIGILLPMNKSAHSNNASLNNILGQTTNVGQNYNNTGTSGASVFALSYSTEEQAVSNLKNLLATTRGERFMQPLFGTRIREAVFQPNTQNLESFIEDTVSEAIDLWLPYINLSGIDVIRDVDNYSFAFRINFSITETGANRVIIVLLDEDNIVVQTEDTEEVTQALVSVGTFGDEFASGAY